MLQILLADLEGVLAKLHADLGGGIVHKVPIAAKCIAAAASGTLLVGVSVGALLLWLRGYRRWW